MRVLISTVGTRGDVQPAVALAMQLRALGHEARLCAPPNFTDWIADLGFDARPIGVAMRAPPPGSPPPKTPQVIPDLIADQFTVIDAAADGCGLIVGAGVHQYAARSVAEARGLPVVVAAYAPNALPNAELAPPGAAPMDHDPAAIALAWATSRAQWNARSLDRVNGQRARLGLAAVDDVLGHILGEAPWLAADVVLGPAPASAGEVAQTGAWLLDDTAPLPRALEAFLAAGEAPVYAGLGSMPAAPRAASALIAAARAAGRRLVLNRGWAELSPQESGADILVIDDVSHEALFPRVAAVIHHGGAGTTTAAARAGTAQVISPMFGDQFYWAERVWSLGIGSVAPGAGTDDEALSRALRCALRAEVAEQAGSLAGRVSGDGAAAAARRLVATYG